MSEYCKCGHIKAAHEGTGFGKCSGTFGCTCGCSYFQTSLTPPHPAPQESPQGPYSYCYIPFGQFPHTIWYNGKDIAGFDRESDAVAMVDVRNEAYAQGRLSLSAEIEALKAQAILRGDKQDKKWEALKKKLNFDLKIAKMRENSADKIRVGVIGALEQTLEYVAELEAAQAPVCPKCGKNCATLESRTGLCFECHMGTGEAGQ